MVNEEWRQCMVDGEVWPYEVSNIGRVRRNGLIRKQKLHKAGYPIISLWRNNTERLAYVHRLVAEAFIGRCPPGHEVNHIDSNRQNPVITNLEYVTRSGNMKHCVAMGRHVVHNPRGSKNPYTQGVKNRMSKLSDEVVRAIILDIQAGNMAQRGLAQKYGVCQQTISLIATGKRWTHVPRQS